MTPDSFLEPEIVLKGETLVLSGIVTHKTVVKVWQEGLRLIKKQYQDLSIDLGGVTQCDSSGLALCTAWARAAFQIRKNIAFTRVPSFMQDLLRVYGLDKVLNVKNF